MDHRAPQFVAALLIALITTVVVGMVIVYILMKSRTLDEMPYVAGILVAVIIGLIAGFYQVFVSKRS